MAKTFLVPIDLLQNEIRNVRVQNLGTAPTSPSPVKGQIYYNTASDKLFYWDGTQWVDMTGGVSSLAGTSPIQVDQSTGAVTVSILAASGSNAGSMSSAHYTLVNNATVSSTANTLVLRDSNGVFNTGTPTANTHVVNKLYVDNLVQGLDAKASVKAATTANITLSGTQTIDGIALSADDRVLVKDQTTASQNGIYLCKAGGWVRATDMDTDWTEVPSAYTWVEQGTINGDTGWLCTSDAGGTLGTTPITWTQFSGAGSINAGAGLTKSGNTLDVVSANASIVVNADSIEVQTDNSTIEVGAGVGIRVKDAGITAAKLNTNVADQSTITGGAATALSVAGYTVVSGATVSRKKVFTSQVLAIGTPLVLTHNLNTKAVQVFVVDSTTNDEYVLDVKTDNVNSVSITSQVVKTVDVTVIG